jgi:RNA polymerase sigma factor (sigma-70 family)
MDAQTDAQLLRAYAARRSDTAFAELVRRHIDLVHSAARRMVGDAHLADDVTQATFLALAKSATQLTERAVLAGWLHRTAQNIAAQTVRTDVRRRAREQEAATMNELLADSGTGVPPVWSEIAPHLDAALDELSEPEGDAVLLRYFQRQTARDMAQTLGISDEAAQKRVSRAMERLREFFAKRGVTVGAGSLAVVISANAVQAAPVGLTLTITTAAALAGTTLATSTTVTATKAIAMTALQKTIVTATIAVLAGAGIYEARQASQLRDQVQTLQQQQAPLTAQVLQLNQALTDATNLVAGLSDENARFNRNTSELLKLRGEVAMILRDNAELRRQHGLSPLSSPSQEAASTLPAINADDFTATTYPTGPADMPTNHYGNPLNYTFPASAATPCSIHGLLNQCMEVSGWRYLIDKEVAAGSVNFGRTNAMNGQEWVEAFENALQFGEPEWWVVGGKKQRKENLVLLRYPQERTVLVLPQDKAANYK